MLTLPPTPSSRSPDQIPDLDRELRKHGITRVRVEYFEVNGFRYLNVRDAIVEARRHETDAAAGSQANISSDAEKDEE